MAAREWEWVSSVAGSTPGSGGSAGGSGSFLLLPLVCISRLTEGAQRNRGITALVEMFRGEGGGTLGERVCKEIEDLQRENWSPLPAPQDHLDRTAAVFYSVEAITGFDTGVI